MFALDWTNEDFFVPGSSCYKWGVFHYSSSLCGIRLHDYYRMVSKLRVGLPTPCMLADEEIHTCTVGEHSQPLSQPLTPYRRPLNLKLRLEMVQQLRALPILPMDSGWFPASPWQLAPVLKFSSRGSETLTHRMQAGRTLI